MKISLKRTVLALVLCALPVAAQAASKDLTDAEILAAAVKFAEADRASGEHAYGSDDERDSMADVTSIVSEDGVTLLRFIVSEGCKKDGFLTQANAPVCALNDPYEVIDFGYYAIVDVRALDCATTHNYLSVDRRTGAVTYLWEYIAE